MQKIKNNFIIRTITGLIFALIIIGVIYFNLWLFTALFLFVSLFTLKEFLNFSPVTLHKFDKSIIYISATLIYLSFALINLLSINGKYLIFIIALILISIIILIFYKKRDNTISLISFYIFSLLYTVIPYALLNFFPKLSTNNNLPEYFFLIVFFAIIWHNDIMAYLSGKIFGKHKLCIEISPGKTWEGLIGSALFTLGSAFILQYFFSLQIKFFWYIFVIIILILGNFGDLLESLFKRNKGIKDSGNFFPGHGGFLDRFDSTLMAAPGIFMYLYFLFY